jgi:hypothetical protein
MFNFRTSTNESRSKNLSFSNWSPAGGFPLQITASLTNYEDHLPKNIFIGGFLPNAEIKLTL